MEVICSLVIGSVFIITGVKLVKVQYDKLGNATAFVGGIIVGITIITNL